MADRQWFKNLGPHSFHIKPRSPGALYHTFHPGEVIQALDADEEKILTAASQVTPCDKPVPVEETKSEAKGPGKKKG